MHAEAHPNDADPSTGRVTLYDSTFWSIDRHTLVAAAADDLLSDRAREWVREVLAPVGAAGLGPVAGWADLVKRRDAQPGDDPETRAFLEDPRNRRRNGPWHYVNLPAEAEEYSRERHPEFTRDDDVVQMYGEAVRVFTEGSTRFSPANALRLIAHLVGDLHQPIHVGCGYLDTGADPARLVLDPVRAVALRSDQGGNALILTVGTRGVSLHSYWDGRLGGNGPIPAPAGFDAGGAGAAPPAGLSTDAREAVGTVARAARESAVAGAAAFTDTERPDRWAVAWAAESLTAAREAYRSLVIKGERPGSDDEYEMEWEGREAYEARCGPIVQKRMGDAARNLAALVERLAG